jgi:hypothetical protein
MLNKSDRLIVFSEMHPILLQYLENIFQVVSEGNTMTNIPVNANEAPKTPVEGAPAKPAQQDQGNQPSKPSEQK